MDSEDALALLTVARLDRDPPPPIEPEKMARLGGRARPGSVAAGAPCVRLPEHSAMPLIAWDADRFAPGRCSNTASCTRGSAQRGGGFATNGRPPNPSLGIGSSPLCGAAEFFSPLTFTLRNARQRNLISINY
jgi:hypothetical protein